MIITDLSCVEVDLPAVTGGYRVLERRSTKTKETIKSLDPAVIYEIVRYVDYDTLKEAKEGQKKLSSGLIGTYNYAIEVLPHTLRAMEEAADDGNQDLS